MILYRAVVIQLRSNLLNLKDRKRTNKLLSLRSSYFRNQSCMIQIQLLCQLHKVTNRSLIGRVTLGVETRLYQAVLVLPTFPCKVICRPWRHPKASTIMLFLMTVNNLRSNSSSQSSLESRWQITLGSKVLYFLVRAMPCALPTKH